ncbi:MAG: T9SS type A sorting domain-containing protein [Bacteroidales bacterium]|jgi:hypothetical protein
MKKLIVMLFALISLPLAMLSQEHNTVEFDYDDAGNRTLRRTIYLIPITKALEEGIVDTLQNRYTEKSIPADEVVLGDVIIHVFPNPTFGRFSVRLENLSESDKVLYSLFTLTGQLVYKGEISNAEIEMNLQDQKNGTYLFKLSINSEITTWKVIKQ